MHASGGVKPRVLLTGAQGFVGSHLARVLCSGGFDVTAVVRRPGAPLAGAGRVLVLGDADASTDWSAALEGIDCIVNCAALAHQGRKAGLEMARYESANAGVVESLARAAARAGVRKFIQLSTVKVFGEDSGERAWTVRSECRPQGPYATSKWHGEQALRAIAAQSGMRYAIIRLPLVYGPGVRANLLALIRWVDRGIPLPLGALANRRSFVGIGNLCDLILRLASVHAETTQDIVLVSDGHDLSTPALVRLIADCLGKPVRLLDVPPWLIRRMARLVGRADAADRLCGSLAVDISETRSQLGWSPPMSDREQMQVTAQWYRQAAGGVRT